MYSVDHLLKRHQEDIRSLNRAAAASWRLRKREYKAMLNAFQDRLGDFSVPRQPRFPVMRRLVGAMAAAVVTSLVVLIG